MVPSSFSPPANKGTVFPFTLLLPPEKLFNLISRLTFLDFLEHVFLISLSSSLGTSPFYSFSATLVDVFIPGKPGVYSLDCFHLLPLFLVSDNNARALGNFFPARTPGCLWAPI